MNISACIPSRGPAIGLWATIASLQAAGVDDFNVALSCPKTESHSVMESYGVKIYECPTPLSPPEARNLAAYSATGDVLLFVDDHCVIPKKLVDGLICTPDVLHFPYRPQVGRNAPTYYHFVGGKSMVEGDYSKEPHKPTTHPVASANHGCFAVRRKAWLALGGYYLPYIGFGGEEASFDLSAWAAGLEVWLDPSTPYYHFSARSGERGYDKTISPANYEMALLELAPHLPGLRDKFARLNIPC